MSLVHITDSILGSPSFSYVAPHHRQSVRDAWKQHFDFICALSKRRNPLPSDAAPYPRRAESSVTQPSKAKDMLKRRSDNTFPCVFSYPPQRFASMSKHVILTRNLVRMPVWSVCTEALFYVRFKRFRLYAPSLFHLRPLLFGLMLFGWFICIEAFFWEYHFRDTYLLTYLLHGAESFLRSYLVCS